MARRSPRLLRSLRLLTAATAASCAMIAGCTFLIGFDEVPAPSEAGLEASAPGNLPDVRIDVPAMPDAQPAVDAGPDVRDAVANPDACKGNLDGKYCGGDQISWPGSKDDLVTCKAGVVSNVKLCGAGIGCIRMLSGYPDQCDECATKVDGTYCGRDMPGWDPSNGSFRVRCQNHAEVGLVLCSAPGCASNGASSACK